MWKCPRAEGEGTGRNPEPGVWDGFGLCLSLAPTSKSLISLCKASKTRAWTLDFSGYWEEQSLTTGWTGVGLVICR